MLRGLIVTTCWVFVWIVVWDLAVNVFDIPQYVLPTPQTVARKILADRILIFVELLATSWKAVLAAFVATGFALALTVISHSTRGLRSALLVTTSVLEAAPKVALAPMLTIWLGIGAEPKIALAVLICVYPTYQRLDAAWSSVPTEITDYARALGCSRLRLNVSIRMRWIVPDLWECLRLATPLAFVGVMLAEIGASEDGIGTVLMYGVGQLDMPSVVAVTVCIGVVSTILVLLFSAVHERALRGRGA